MGNMHCENGKDPANRFRTTRMLICYVKFSLTMACIGSHINFFKKLQYGFWCRGINGMHGKIEKIRERTHKENRITLRNCNNSTHVTIVVCL